MKCSGTPLWRSSTPQSLLHDSGSKGDSMNDFELLGGSSVKLAGQTGRIVSVFDDKVEVAWYRRGLASEIEVFPRTSDKLTEEIKVLTLKEGWVPLAKVLETQEDRMGTVTEIIEELNVIAGHDPLEEALSKKKTKKRKITRREPAPKINKHNPFINSSPIGTGPDGAFGTRTVSAVRDWKCKGRDYNQICKGASASTKGRIKHVHIKKEYKHRYNKAYKAWAAKQA